MARARNIKPSFFTNDELAECSFAARLLFIGLWTLADREGRVEDRSKRIKASIFPFDDVAVPELLVELHERKFIFRYTGACGTQVIGIPNFVKHQRPHPNEAPSELPAPQLNITSESGNEMANCALSLNPLSLNPSSLNPLSLNAAAAKSHEPAPAEKPRLRYPSAFEAWWKAYPRKVGKQSALKRWLAAGRALIAEGRTKQEAADYLLESAIAFADSPKGKGAYCPHPSTWLNEGRYDDDRSTWNEDRPNGKSHGRNAIAPGSVYDGSPDASF